MIFANGIDLSDKRTGAPSKVARSVRVVFIGFRDAGVLLWTDPRDFLEHARKVQLVGEAAHLGDLVDLVVVDVLAEQQLLRERDARIVEELKGRDALFLDELTAYIVLAERKRLVDVVQREGRVGEVFDDRGRDDLDLPRAVVGVGERGQNVDDKLGEREDDVGLISRLRVEIAIAKVEDVVDVLLGIVGHEQRLFEGRGPIGDGHVDVAEARLGAVGMQCVRRNDDDLIARVLDGRIAVEKFDLAVAAGAVDDLPIVVLVTRDVVGLHVLSDIIDDGHVAPPCFDYSRTQPFCP